MTIRGGYAGWDGAAFDWTTRALRSSIVDLTNTTSRALYLNANKTVTLEGLTFRNSRTTQSSGGAIYFNNHNTLTLTDCLFTNNVITAGSGGAVCSIPGGWTTAPRILNCDFVDNAAPNAGALYLQPYYANTTLLVSNCLFKANQATVDGGAVGLNNAFQIVSYDQMLFVDCVFRDNTAGDEGGAVCGLYSGFRHRMRRCTFVGNRAQQGAAYSINIDNAYWGSPVFFEQSLFYSNTCTTAGNKYAIYIAGQRENPAYIDIDQCTIVHNDGGIYNARISAGQRELRVRNSIIAFNAGFGINCDGAPVLTHNNVYGNGNNYGGTAAAGVGCLSSDPLFADAANNDYRLSRGSPCVDTGADLGLTPDLDGIVRPTRDGYDMGCYEEWQIPIIANRAAVATATNAEVRAEFTYESADIATDAYFVIDTSDKGTNSLAAWSLSASVGERTQGTIFGTTFSGLSPATTYWYRCMASNSYDVIWGPVAWFTTPSEGGATRLWTGLGGNALASNTNNWQEGLAPAAGDYALLDSSPSNMTWDAGVNGLPDTVARWTQTENYIGTVTFDTTYPEFSATFTNFTVTGDATINGGAWTHINQPSSETLQRRLHLTVEGDLRVGTSGTLHGDAKGFPVNRGPGKPTGSNPAHGGSHGGIGGFHVGTPNDPLGSVYGSIVVPTALGSGAGPNSGCGGGGAVLLDVKGALTVDGAISVVGASTHRATGAGGSIFIRAGALVGGSSGVLRANGGPATESGGSGGRISVILSNGDFSAFGGSITAYGSGNVYRGAAGTVYLQTSSQGNGQGTLILDNNNGVPHTLVDTRMPPAANLNTFSAVIITNRATLGIAADTTLTFGTANLLTAGSANSFIKIVNPSLTTFSNPYVLSGYTLIGDGLTEVTGDWTIGSGGVLTHRGPVIASTQMPPAEFKLDFILHGNLTVAAGGAIRADERGYFRSLGLGAPSGGAYGGSHGGVGGMHNQTPGFTLGSTYGSILAPTLLGSGGGSNSGVEGGGVIRLDVRGALTVEASGTISANGRSTRGGSGGSVYLMAETLTGAGTIAANGVNGEVGGGGGRVAIHLSSGDFSGFTGTLRAFGGDGSNAIGDAAPGSVYLSPSGGNPQVRFQNYSGAVLSPGVVADIRDPAGLEDATLSVVNTVLQLKTDLTANALNVETAATLDLNGKILKIRGDAWVGATKLPSGSHSAADLGGVRVTDSAGTNGRIVVLARGTVMMLR